jgi:hypothetical protein
MDCRLDKTNLMHLNEWLTDKNFLIFCAKHYRVKKYFTDEEFLEDLNRIKYIKKLITRYIENDDLKERLILNHIIILNNCFGPVALNKILYLKLKSQFKYIKPFLLLLNILQEKIHMVNNEKIIYTDEIAQDQTIIDRLRKI